MKRMTPTFPRPHRFVLLACIFAATFFPARAQDARLRINDLDRLAAKAATSVNVNIDGSLLQQAAKFLSGKDPEEAKVKDMIAGIKGIYVKSFEFDEAGTYTEADVQAIRSQIQREPGWTSIIEVRSKRDDLNVEVYVKKDGESVTGLAVIGTDLKNLTIVNIVGAVDLDKLSQLEGNFGVPLLELQKTSKPPHK
ncbi:MAG: DUF4252 domain-containing protein [Pyrinomonadaceae bacterium]